MIPGPTVVSNELPIPCFSALNLSIGRVRAEQYSFPRNTGPLVLATSKENLRVHTSGRVQLTRGPHHGQGWEPLRHNDGGRQNGMRQQRQRLRNGV